MKKTNFIITIVENKGTNNKYVNLILMNIILIYLRHDSVTDISQRKQTSS